VHEGGCRISSFYHASRGNVPAGVCQRREVCHSTRLTTLSCISQLRLLLVGVSIQSSNYAVYLLARLRHELERR